MRDTTHGMATICWGSLEKFLRAGKSSGNYGAYYLPYLVSYLNGSNCSALRDTMGWQRFQRLCQKLPHYGEPIGNCGGYYLPYLVNDQRLLSLYARHYTWDVDEFYGTVQSPLKNCHTIVNQVVIVECITCRILQIKKRLLALPCGALPMEWQRFLGVP